MGAWRSWKMVPLHLIASLLLLGGSVWATLATNSTWGTAVAAGLLSGVLACSSRMMMKPAPTLALVAFALSLTVLALMSAITPTLMLQALVIAALFSAAWYLLWDVWVTRSVNAEVRSSLTAMGDSDAPDRALIVQHPGRSGFHARLELALADSLVLQGWRVDITTPSSITPLKLSPYGLLVLGAPVYSWRAAMPLLTYIERLGDLRRPPVALVLSGGGVTDAAMTDLKRRVADIGGDIIEAIEVWTEHPNAPRHGLSDPEAIMRRAGVQISTNVRSWRSKSQAADLDAKLTAREQTFPASDPAWLRFDRPHGGDRRVFSTH